MEGTSLHAALVLFCLCWFVLSSECLPKVDPGVFVLQGVHTCRSGKGYCILGRSCTVDKDFEADDQDGNCAELKKSFSSKLSFVCCKYVDEPEEPYYTTVISHTTKDGKFELMDKNPIPLQEMSSSAADLEGENPEDLFGIVGLVTDTTGIIELITQPYRPSSRSTTPTIYTPTSTTPTFSTTTFNTPTTITNQDKVFSTRNKIGVNYRKEDFSQNEFQILNLPQEIKKYLFNKNMAKKRSEENQTLGQRATKPNNPTTQKYYVTDGEGGYYSTTEVSVLSTEPFTYTEEELYSTEGLPHLKRNPLVPMVRKKEGVSSDSVVLEESGKNSSQVTVSTSVTESFEDTSTVASLLKSKATHQKTEAKTTASPPLNSTLEDTNSTEASSFNSTLPLQESSAKKSQDKFSVFERLQDIYKNETKKENEVILPYPLNLNICGLTRTSLKVTDRPRAASTYDWCWSAALMEVNSGEEKFQCSGTLVELDLVITTAACLKRLRYKDLSSLRVVLGDSNLRDHLPYGIQFRNVEEFVTHPDYLTSGGAHANDIGLIRLRETATIDNNVCLACVPQANAYIPDDSCVLSGYTMGDIPRHVRTAGLFSRIEGILRQAPVALEKASECQATVERLAPNPLLVTNPGAFLCDAQKESARSCMTTFDGGSPLVCQVGGRWFLAGLSSWSRDCTSDPNIYTRVSSFSDWFLNTRLRMYGFISHKV